MVSLKEARLPKRSLVFSILMVLACSSTGTLATAQEVDLVQAAERGDLPSVGALLARGTSVNAKRRDGATALFMASQEGNLEVVQLLLAKGADVNAKTNNGRTALMIASYKGQRKVAQALLAKGADINARTSDGRTALDAATAGGYEDLRALLAQASLPKGAEVKAKTKDGATAQIHSDSLSSKPEPKTQLTQVQVDGVYVGPSDVLPMAGACAPISSVLLTITGNAALLTARRVAVMGGSQYSHSIEYVGSVNGAGEVTVEAHLTGYAAQRYAAQRLTGAGTIRGGTFKGKITNSDVLEETGRCDYKLELHRK